jgi:molybdopterin-guanine dinucleotide biosynthesis protein A
LIQGAILAGGGATRYGGQPKGLLSVGGVRILDRLVAAFETALGGRPLLIANAPDAQGWRSDLRVAADVLPDCGSLGGIYTAVREGPAPVVCVAWDMPFVSAGLIRALAEGILDGYDACLPESGGPRGVEPLCAAYGPACGPAIAERIHEGDLRAIGFHAGLKVGILNLEQIGRLGVPEFLFFNVNTPDDLKKAETLWRDYGSSRSSD